MEKLPRVNAMKFKVLTAVLLSSLALNVVIGAIIAFRIVFIGGEHGTAWLSIGPALFSACKRIEWFHGYGKKIENGKPVTHEGKDGVVWIEMDLKNPNIETVTKTDKSFPAVLTWIENYFANKLNTGPTMPSFDCATYEALILYSSEKPAKDETDWSCRPHLLRFDNGAKEEHGDVLLVIPLIPQTLGPDDKIFKQRLVELDAIFHSKPIPGGKTTLQIAEEQRQRAYRVENNRRYGFLDKDGKVVFTARDADCLDWRFSDGLLWVRTGNKVGFWDKTGRSAFAQTFDDALRFSEGLSAVKSSTEWGFVDKTGNYAIEPRFDAVNSFLNGLAPACLGKQWGFIRRDGTFAVKPQFDACLPFNEGLAAASKNKKVGFIDESGKWIIEPQFEAATSFSCGRSRVTKLEGPQKLQQQWFIDKNGKKVFYLDELKARLSKSFGEEEKTPLNNFCRRELIGTDPPPIGSDPDDRHNLGLIEEFSENLLNIPGDTENYFVDVDGKVVLTIPFAIASDFREGLASVCTTRDGAGKYGFVDTKGNVVIAPQFDYAEEFSDGVAIVCKDNFRTHGYVDKKGRFFTSDHFAISAPFVEGLVRFGSSP